nr:MAG TPA: hypothetical protein [Caudoviricetes sp.]
MRCGTARTGRHKNTGQLPFYRDDSVDDRAGSNPDHPVHGCCIGVASRRKGVEEMTLEEKTKAFLTANSGDGYGSGSGDGSGYGIKSFNGEPIYRIDGVNTLIRSVRGNTAHGAIVNADLTLTPCYIVKQGNVFAHGETLREAMEALRGKLFKDMPEDERIDTFLRETDREKAYPTQYFYDWHHRLTGSCDMGRKQFARDHGVDLEHGIMTLAEFLELTKDAYGGDVIRKVISKMQEVE